MNLYQKAIESGDYTPDEKYLLLARAKKHCKELENQMAIADIAHKQANVGTDFSANAEVSDEWISRFLEAGKFVSDEEVQLLWGSILAGEFEEPGSTPPGTIRILSELTQQYALVFSNLCSLSVDLLLDSGTNINLQSDICFIDMHSDSGYLQKYGLAFIICQELEHLGLINFDPIAGFAKTYTRADFPKIHIVYGNQVLSVTDYKEKVFPIGHVVLTQAGQRIAQYTQRKFVPEHMAAVKSYIKSNGGVCSESPEIAVTQVIEETGKRKGYNYRRL